MTLDARPADGEGMVAGDVVNTAARLQSAAPVNGRARRRATYRATDRCDRVRGGEPRRGEGEGRARRGVGGRGAALAVRHRRGAGTARRRSSVGRTEVDVLVGCARREPVRTSQPQLVTLVGVPGIGKSRLVTELLADGRGRARADHVAPGAIACPTARAIATGLRRDGKGAGRHARRRRVRPTPREADRGGGRPDARRTRPHGSSRTPAAAGRSRQRRPVAARQARGGVRSVAALLRGAGEQRPTVLVFEDLHWADDGLLEFVDGLVDRLDRRSAARASAPRGRSCSTRRPDWGGGKPNAATLSLSPLSDDETARLMPIASRGGAAGGHAADAAAPGGRQPALRRGVRPHAQGSWAPAPRR